MFSVQLYQQVKLIYGEGAITKLGKLAKSIQKKKALFVCDPGMAATGMADRVIGVLNDSGIDCSVYDKNQPNPLIRAAEEAYEQSVRDGCDFVIGLGGGSNIDCAKGVNILRHNPGPLIQYANFGKPFDPGKDLIVIPTTAGTGSEMSDGAILSDDQHIKYNFIADRAMAEYAILDPELTEGMPASLTAATGLDALAHAVEAYTSTLATDFSDVLAEKVMDEIGTYLPRAVADGKDHLARREMTVASSMAGYLLVAAHTNAGHSIGQTLGGYFGIPHGTACAYAEPWVLEFNAPACPEKIRRIGQALGADFSGKETPEEIGRKTREAWIRFRDDACGLRPAVDYGYDREKFDEIAQVCADEFFQQFNPRKMTKEDCLNMVQNIYQIRA